jgi:hypothetical protein
VPVIKSDKGKPGIWVTLEVIEVIELKRIVMDRDVAEAVDFFQAVITPKVRAAAERRGMALADYKETGDGRLPG